MNHGQQIEAQLVVVGGDANNQTVQLRLPTTIGRGKEATLTVPHALVSRLHCEINEKNGILVVKDLGSLNGTYVNNLKITTEQPLLPGELLTLGSITFRASYEPKCQPQAAGGQASERDRPLAGGGYTDRPMQDNSPVFPKEQRKAAPAPSPLPVAATGGDITHDSTTPGLIPGDSTIDFAEIGPGSPEKSISLSSIDSLPRGNQNISFVSGFPADDDSSEIELSEVHIDLGVGKLESRNVDVDRLDSFIKKKK